METPRLDLSGHHIRVRLKPSAVNPVATVGISHLDHMKGASVFYTVTAVCLAALQGAVAQPQIAGSHTDLPRWCGKPYQSG
jgi:hypothetical protein